MIISAGVRFRDGQIFLSISNLALVVVQVNPYFNSQLLPKRGRSPDTPFISEFKNQSMQTNSLIAWSSHEISLSIFYHQMIQILPFNIQSDASRSFSPVKDSWLFLRIHLISKCQRCQNILENLFTNSAGKGSTHPVFNKATSWHPPKMFRHVKPFPRTC